MTIRPRPRPPISAATASTCSAVRAVTATCIPAAASSRATSAPIPRPPPVTSATPSSRSDDTCDLLQCLGVLERREVARVLPEDARANRAADDLRAPRLRQRADEQDPLRAKRVPQLVRHARTHLTRQL